MRELDGLRLFRIARLAEEFWALMATVNLVAIAVSVGLYLKGKYQWSLMGEPVEGYTHGSFGLDFWVGR